MDQDVQEEFRQTMDPSSSSSSNYEKIDESIEAELAKEDSDSEGFSDGDADDELGIDLIKAAMKGNAQIFDDPNLSFEHLSRKSSVLKNNILHIAVRYEQEEFVRALLTKKRYMAMNKKLISEKNSHGNTPFHLAAQLGDRSTIRLMYGLYKYMKKKRVEGGHDDDDDEEKPWRAQNSEGNTALHVALLSGNFYVARYLVERDGGLLARMVNNSQEAPLHLAITHLAIPDDCISITCVFLNKARCVATWRDAKGLTPLLRAASLLNPFVILEVTKEIIAVCPESTLVCDPFGKSFLHLLIHNNKIFDPKYLDVDTKDLICLNEISILENHQDQDGHTPLHIALKCDNIHMARSLVSKCSANLEITNKDGISASSMIDQLNLWRQLHEPRAMTKEESSSANKGNINFLLEIQRTTGLAFYGSQDSKGRNFLHLLMSKTTEHHYLSSSDDCREFFRFIESALLYFPKLVCETDQIGNTPLHILAQNKDFCKTLADSKFAESTSLLSELLSICAITRSNEADNHDLPWVMQNSGGNTPLHEAIIANNRVMVLELLCYRKESARIVNKHKKTPLHLLAATSIGTMEFTVEEIMEIVNANIEALGLLDKDGLIPIFTAVKAENQQMVVAILRIVQNYNDNDGQNSWHLVLNHSSKNFVNVLLQSEAFRNMLQQKDKDGNTPLHLAIKDKCLKFVQDLLEASGGEHELSEENSWPMDLLRISNNAGEIPEDLLADLSILPKELEKILLTDRRMRGIRSSWGIPRTQLQNYMSSMNVIAALQTTFTFTAAFTVPGGLSQEIGTPILIQRIAFQVFMISDVIAMCLSMMVLICLLWMVATNKRESVMIQDFALTLLLASFVATLFTFMTGVYATIYPAKPWIAITTLVLCSLLMLFLHRYMLTNLLLLSKYYKGRFVKKFSQRAHSSNTQEQRSDSAV